MEIFFSSDVDGGLVRLNQEESAHCVRVLRHRAGDEVCIIDGCGTMMRCTLLEASPYEAVARIEEKIPGWGSHPYHLTMAVCPTKNADRFEWFAEKATEIGVDVIAPVIGDRSERKVYKTDRIRRLLLSAAKQSLKGAVPEVAEPQSVREFIASAPADSLKLIAYCFEGEKLSIREALEAWNGGRVCVLIGPEGDFSPAEVADALKAGFKPVHLGASRLRTETAALTSVAAVYMKYM
ncbi:MAG: 16S rRNA (uracil(1498)-N(3))-methyltransferase [Bacteroidales bacterium]|nr:16S rRNA (uracil(1498)-N(3))-methyltransferase [Candidatus Cryptobacteroides aphodequi]